MSAIGNGDWVQLLHDSRWINAKRGDVFCVEATFAVGDCEGCSSSACVGLHLYDVPKPREFGLAHLAWSGCSFRPLGGNASKTIKRWVPSDLENA